jgi:penicillin-binding protein 1A
MKRILKIGFWSLLFVWVVAGVGVGAYLTKLIWQVPNLDSITAYKPMLTSKILDSENEAIGELYEENRILIPYDQIPPLVVKAFLAVEDQNFFHHQGLDFQGILRAFIANLKAGKVVQGGSTITQQVTKSLLLSPERKYSRKIKEAWLAYNMEKKLSKEEILTLYLNQIYLGHGAYGISQAAWNYFRKPVSKLSIAEMALLAGLPQAPARFDPLISPVAAKKRQQFALQQMAGMGAIKYQEADAAASQALKVYPVPLPLTEPSAHFAEFVRRELLKKMSTEDLYRGGWVIKTTLDSKLQSAAQKAVLTGLEEIDKRRGYRGPLRSVPVEAQENTLAQLKKTNFLSSIQAYFLTTEGKLEPIYDHPPNTPIVGKDLECLVLSVNEQSAVLSDGAFEGTLSVKSASWARTENPKVHTWMEPVQDLTRVLKPGDIVLARRNSSKQAIYTLSQEPLIEGALLAIHIPTGHVLSMVGGKNFRKSQFNRGYQAMRQLGSTIKPIIYSKALEIGLPPNTLILDAPIVFETDKPDGPQPAPGEPSETQPSEPLGAGNNPSGPEKHIWKPDNYEESFLGDITLHQALAQSRNVPTIKLVQAIGVGSVIEFAENLGLNAEFPKDLSLSLGSVSVSLWDILKPFGVFANAGKSLDFKTIASIEHPQTLFALQQETVPNLRTQEVTERQLLTPQLAYLMTAILKDVVLSGTARSVNKLGKPFAGKTGTTNDFVDAWFIGYTPDILTGVWVGFDTPKYIGIAESGAKAAAPIWLEFMQEVVKKYPIQDFSMPPGIEMAYVHPDTGKVGEGNPKDLIPMAFIAGTVPQKPRIVGGFERIKPEALPDWKNQPNVLPSSDERSTPKPESPQEQTREPNPAHNDEDLIFGQYE